MKCVSISPTIPVRKASTSTKLSLRYHKCILTFIFQLMHTTLKNVELLKHFKNKEAAPTCFGLQGNHHQGAWRWFHFKPKHVGAVFFWTVHISTMKTKINQQNAQINSGLIYYWSITCFRSIQWLCNSQGFRTPWWWLRLRGRNMLEWLISNKLIQN